jgi:hypothetical protein
VNRGYAGYYNNVYLRSSYEYAYAKYLDFKGIRWTYEERTYDLGCKKYKPDFFLYNDNDELQLIVEIKQRNSMIREKTILELNTLKNLYNIESEIVSYNELLILYKELPFSLTTTISEWLNSNETTINKSTLGNLNPHYNISHNPDTKKSIGEATKRRWQDPKVREKMLAGQRKGAESVKAKKGKWIKVPREDRYCKICGDYFIALITSKRRFCTDICAGRYGFEEATKVYVEKRKSLHRSIKEYVLKWTKANGGIIKGTPFNKIQTNLHPLLDAIEVNFNVKDIRIISKAVLGEQLGRKELLKYLKDVVN